MNSPAWRLAALALALCGACADDKTPVDDSAPPAETGCEDPERWLLDGDGDGFGDPDEAVEVCEAPEGYVSRGGDCDDGDAAARPGGDDPCGDGVDGDCDGEDPACPAEGSLAEADLKLAGTLRSGDAGRHMDAGDIDGDGVEDLVVGEMWARGYEGGAFVIYGPVTESGALGDVGLEIAGGDGSFEGGRSVGVGDLTGDGYDDVLLGSPDASAYDAVVVFGPVTDDLEFADADLRFYCSADVECGHGSDAADIDGDGQMDAIIGAGEERNGGAQTGSVYLLFGPLEPDELDLREDADAEIHGDVEGTETGRVVCAGQDLDGDGLTDLLVTSGSDSTGGPEAGAVYVIYSPVDNDMSFEDAAGKLFGAAAYGAAGEALAMGDLDGDGLADAIVGAAGGGSSDGMIGVIFGPAAGETSLGDADATVEGEDRGGMGTAVAARDVNGDGAAELLAGAGDTDGDERGVGAAYLYYGPLEGALAPGDAALGLWGEAKRDNAGYGVGLADLTGDGAVDVLVGAPRESSEAEAAGALYLISL